MIRQESRPCKRARIAIPCLVTIALLCSNAVSARLAPPSPPPMTVILVRHAEKQIVPPENKDPDLSPAGLARAQGLARMFGDTGITAIYATQYKRTQQTVKPLEEKLGIPVTRV
ncbi:MAG: histidine phosphatase family protein, partial [Pyrinomonadaceae bacterium]